MNSHDTSDGQVEFDISRINYTTAEVEMNWFSGENPDPFYFVMYESPIEMSPMVLTVIDGEVRIVRDESPPGARILNFESALFKFAGDPPQVDSL